MNVRTQKKRTGLSPVPEGCSIFKVEVTEQDDICPLSPVLQDLPVGIIVANAQGRFTLFNRE